MRSACKALSEVLWLKTPEVLEPSNSFLSVFFPLWHNDFSHRVMLEQFHLDGKIKDLFSVGLDLLDILKGLCFIGDEVLAV